MFEDSIIYVKWVWYWESGNQKLILGLKNLEHEGQCRDLALTMCEMDKIAWQKPFSSASDFAIKKSKKIHIFLI